MAGLMNETVERMDKIKGVRWTGSRTRVLSVKEWERNCSRKADWE